MRESIFYTTEMKQKKKWLLDSLAEAVCKKSPPKQTLKRRSFLHAVSEHQPAGTVQIAASDRMLFSLNMRCLCSSSDHNTRSHNRTLIKE
jgi:hypothetical protein